MLQLTQLKLGRANNSVGPSLLTMAACVRCCEVGQSFEGHSATDDLHFALQAAARYERPERTHVVELVHEPLCYGAAPLYRESLSNSLLEARASEKDGRVRRSGPRVIRKRSRYLIVMGLYCGCCYSSAHQSFHSVFESKSQALDRKAKRKQPTSSQGQTTGLAVRDWSAGYSLANAIVRSAHG
ncbi:hypothetical protein H9L39_01625 [Fusarium oxysporum f. sp. albedinis]|nr:hypothetical protein H9L39_01625 [Fusarium oxysporum f. sp. albedinis]